MATMPPEYDKTKSMEHHKKPEDYFIPAYDTKGRFISYWYQINEILGREPRRVLEVGVGNKFVSGYLDSRGVEVVTVDIDERLEPDVTAPVTVIPFADASFDVVFCCQVLEHLPYENFRPALQELRRVASGIVLISLPDSRSYMKFTLQFSDWAATHRLLSHPRLKGRELSDAGEHHWEIGRRGYPLKRIKGDIRAAGLNTVRTHRIFENPYHHFFILER